MSWFARFNPTPAFPQYSGPYKVGSVDVELALDGLESPSPRPDSAPPTIAFRIFYPCEPTARSRPVRWVPHPQRGYIGAYARFLGASSAFAEIFAFIPQLLYYISIPVHRNAGLLPPPTQSRRWPVVVFSHGLGGSRNAYSHICGSLSSHGIVVIAPDHRDGSAPVSYVRATADTEARIVDYKSLPHKPSAKVWEDRDEQLKIRLWELGVVHEAILKIDLGEQLQNLDPNSFHWRKHDASEVLSMFRDTLDVHQPGSIIWAGHSFGASSIVQLVKSTFYRPSVDEKLDFVPLFTPAPGSSIAHQITAKSPVVLLDVWCLPLHSKSTQLLWDKPMPCYAPGGPGGTNLLAVLSEAFFRWQVHLQETKRLLSEDPASGARSHSKPGPRFFYPTGSAHLSQSDFGILFPWVCKKIAKAEEPERTLKLNVRAIVQLLRENGAEVADTSRLDLEDDEPAPGRREAPAASAGRAQDWRILDPSGSIRGWIALGTDVGVGATGDGPAVAADATPPPDALVDGEVLGEVIPREEKL